MHQLLQETLTRILYLAVDHGSGSLTETAKDLVSCEISVWSESVGPTMIGSEELPELISNNKTAKSLTIRECEFFHDGGDWVPTDTPMLDLEICCSADDDFEKNTSCIHTPQFKNLDTAHLFLLDFSLWMLTTDGTGHSGSSARV